jgi:hypothetical protein
MSPFTFAKTTDAANNAAEHSLLVESAAVALDRVRLSLAFAPVCYPPSEINVGGGGLKKIVSQSADQAQAVDDGCHDAAQDPISAQLNVAF